MSLGTQLASITQYWYENKGKKPTNLWFRQDPYLWMLAGRKTPSGAMRIQDEIVKPTDFVQGGRAVRMVLEYGKANTGGWGDGATYPANKKALLTHAEYAWGGVFASNSRTLNDSIVNNGPEAVADLVEIELENMMNTAQESLAYNLYNTQAACASHFTLNNTSTFFLDTGLGTMLNATGTCGGIAYNESDMGTVTNIDGSSKYLWEPEVVATASTMGFSFIMEGIRRARVKSTPEGEPDLILTTEALQDSYINTCITLKRLTENGELADAGFRHAAWNGTPIVGSVNQTSGYCDFLNTRYIHLKTHSQYPFTKPEWRSPWNAPDDFVAGTRYIGALGTTNRRAHARYSSVSAAA